MSENPVPDGFQYGEDYSAVNDGQIEPTGSISFGSPENRSPQVQESEFDILRGVHAQLMTLPPNARRRSIIWLIDALQIEDIDLVTPNSAIGQPPQVPPISASVHADPTPSPRDFMSQKKPRSQVERIACLAYYLLKFRGIQSVRSIELSGLNLEAAGQKFGNISRDIDNADRQNGFIVTAGTGAKQLTARGEAVVEALPDREAVKRATQEHPYRSKRQSGRARTIGTSTEDGQ